MATDSLPTKPVTLLDSDLSEMSKNETLKVESEGLFWVAGNTRHSFRSRDRGSHGRPRAHTVERGQGDLEEGKTETPLMADEPIYGKQYLPRKVKVAAACFSRVLFSRGQRCLTGCVTKRKRDRG